MRNWTYLVFLLASHTAVAEYSESRFLNVDASGVSELIIDAAAGSLEVTGRDGADGISVEATIRLYDPSSDEKAEKIIGKRVRLSLERDGETVRLISNVRSSFFSRGAGPVIDMKVVMPPGIRLAIDDGSGSLKVADVAGDLLIDDGSGGIELSDVGRVDLDDGSGNIRIERAAGDVTIDDGSGGIDVSEVQGSLFIEDGSGGISVDGVGGDLVIVDDGSGSLSFKNVQGSVRKEED